MSISVADSRAADVRVDERFLTVILGDGREVSAPLSWFPRLTTATPEERDDWRLIGPGEGIHWPQLDEDISVRALLTGEC